MEPEISAKYGHKVRIRVCGLCWRNDDLLLINHTGLTEGDFWSPPGGGVEFGQSAHDAIIREFQEETHLTVALCNFRFVCEYIKPPLHAVELFFDVSIKSGNISLGSDPEHKPDRQILRNIRWFNFRQLMAIPADERHGIFRYAKTASALRKLCGFYRI
jgi:8-oxo-dGTP diphosphatase